MIAVATTDPVPATVAVPVCVLGPPPPAGVNAIVKVTQLLAVPRLAFSDPVDPAVAFTMSAIADMPPPAPDAATSSVNPAGQELALEIVEVSPRITSSLLALVVIADQVAVPDWPEEPELFTADTSTPTVLAYSAMTTEE